jgi:hypothetical protein
MQTSEIRYGTRAKFLVRGTFLDSSKVVRVEICSGRFPGCFHFFKAEDANHMERENTDEDHSFFVTPFAAM